MIRNQRRGGVVKGSVSITKAKKKTGVLTRNIQKFGKNVLKFDTVEKRVVTVATSRKLKTRSKRNIFLVNINPPTSTNGNIHSVPIHQLAEPLIAYAVRTTANAAGLKICFRLMAKIYFEAIAQTDAHAARLKKTISCGDDIGFMISTSIRAVIYADSTFVGALNAHAKMIFVNRQTVVINSTENKRANGLYGRRPKKLSPIATTTNMIK